MAGQPKGKAFRAKAKGKAAAARSVSSAEMLEKLTLKAKQLACQAIRESIHMKGFSSVQMNSTMIDGKTLLDEVSAAKLKWLKGEPSPAFGGNYFRTLSLKYRGEKDPSQLMRPEQDGLPLRESLVEALCAWNDTDRNKGPMQEWLTLQKEAPLV